MVLFIAALNSSGLTSAMSNLFANGYIAAVGTSDDERHAVSKITRKVIIGEMRGIGQQSNDLLVNSPETPKFTQTGK